jgi:Amt family ammonium transporter
VFCIGALGYWLVGFAFQFGGVNYTYPAINGNPEWNFSPVTLGDWSGVLDKPLIIGNSGVLGLSGFMLGGLSANFGVLVFFLFQMVFMDTAATIPTGSMAERLKFKGFVAMSLFVSMFIYPLVGNWVWGGGWLANLGRTWVWQRRSGISLDRVRYTRSVVVAWRAIVLGARIGSSTKTDPSMRSRATISRWVCWARSFCSSAGSASMRDRRWASRARSAIWPCWPPSTH